MGLNRIVTWASAVICTVTIHSEIIGHSTVLCPIISLLVVEMYGVVVSVTLMRDEVARRKQFMVKRVARLYCWSESTLY